MRRKVNHFLWDKYILIKQCNKFSLKRYSLSLLQKFEIWYGVVLGVAGILCGKEAGRNEERKESERETEEVFIVLQC